MWSSPSLPEVVIDDLGRAVDHGQPPVRWADHDPDGGGGARKRPSDTSKMVTGAIAGSTEQVTGTLVGGDPDDTIENWVTVPVSKKPTGPAAAAQAQDVEALATCQILNLLLGPLDLKRVGSAGSAQPG